MDPENEPQPIIVVKKKGHHGDHHGGAWKVAYADFVTAMMAFFLVMWLVNQSEVIKENVGGYFRDPVGFADKSGSSILDRGAGVLPEDAHAEMAEQDRLEKENTTRLQLEAVGESIKDEINQIPGLQELADHIEVEMTDEGLRIQLMESGDSTFFDIGSSTLAENGVWAVTAISGVIAALDYEIVVEGHTDSRRYSRSEVYSNWELSSDRANTARRVLEMNGITPDRFVEIRSFADNQLRFTDHPEDARNRRIAIVILNPFAVPTGTNVYPAVRNKLAGHEPR